MGTGIEDLFGQAHCTGQLCVQSLDGSQQIAVDADRPVVAASVFKVSVALEAETQFADGSLDPHERVTLPAANRTPGPVGFSLFRDDVQASLQDLVVAMLTISDNVATDALLDRLGIDAVNAGSARLGLAGTVITADLRTMVNSIGQDAGFRDWDALWEWAARHRSGKDEQELTARMAAASALIPARTIRTTPADMATLLRLIWSDQAGPPQACGRVRQLMSRQLTKHRLAAAFPPPARVAAKSGSLIGVVRNEVGVIQYPDGRGYAAAVFTQAHQAWQHDAAINAAIGSAAAAAVGLLGA
ncbi:MAG TPA: serine hydrolase [Streptosporangiaceae bacterium]|nr:serine hydrolase [Streptosporangiaceae bacterium]